jgi:hypothetical protein
MTQYVLIEFVEDKTVSLSRYDKLAEFNPNTSEFKTDGFYDYVYQKKSFVIKLLMKGNKTVCSQQQKVLMTMQPSPLNSPNNRNNSSPTRSTNNSQSPLQKKPTQLITTTQSKLPYTRKISIKHVEETIKERDMAIKERDSAIKERDSAIKERDLAISERDQSQASDNVELKADILRLEAALKDRDDVIKENELKNKELALVKKQNEEMKKNKGMYT